MNVTLSGLGHRINFGTGAPPKTLNPQPAIRFGEEDTFRPSLNFNEEKSLFQALSEIHITFKDNSTMPVVHLLAKLFNQGSQSLDELLEGKKMVKSERRNLDYILKILLKGEFIVSFPPNDYMLTLKGAEDLRTEYLSGRHPDLELSGEGTIFNSNPIATALLKTNYQLEDVDRVAFKKIGDTILGIDTDTQPVTVAHALHGLRQFGGGSMADLLNDLAFQEKSQDAAKKELEAAFETLKGKGLLSGDENFLAFTEKGEDRFRLAYPDLSKILSKK